MWKRNGRFLRDGEIKKLQMNMAAHFPLNSTHTKFKWPWDFGRIFWRIIAIVNLKQQKFPLEVESKNSTPSLLIFLKSWKDLLTFDNYCYIVDYARHIYNGFDDLESDSAINNYK